MEDLMNALEIYYDDPAAFLEDLLGMKCDSWQEEVAADVAAYPKVTVKSGQGVGKTALEAGLIIWFLVCRPYSKVIATAPTMQQLYDVLWAEIAKWLSSSLIKNLLTWTKTKIYMAGDSERWFAVAKTATKPENMQGFHEDHMLIVVDEASGVADPIMEAILGTLTGWDNKLLLMSNPTKTSGAFYDSHMANRALYRCHTVNSENSRRTDKDNIAAMKRKYGENSNVVRVRVYGEFPEQEDDVFISLIDIEQCSNKRYELPEEKYSSFIIFGVDVARFGDDETVIYRNAKGRIRLAKSYRGQDLMRTVGEIVALYKQTIKDFPEYKGGIYVNIDDTGLGGGVTDRLNEVKREQSLNRLFVIPINAAEKIETDTKDGKDAADHYNNLTTHMWAVLRDLLRNREIEIADDSDSIAQLASRKYFMASNGKLELESKKEMKKRNLPSPDRGDAMALSVYLGKIKKYTGSVPSSDAINGLNKSSYWRR
ncbi:terminase B [bacterium 1XD8-76]|nr:terminase B [bacterium 1XD8-76]